jgi:hypothetical protein
VGIATLHIGVKLLNVACAWELNELFIVVDDDAIENAIEELDNASLT